jgi:RNA polymerase sigma factor (sigma-70 family)
VTADPRADDERALVLAAEAGDAAARAELVETFLPAIGSIARRYRGFAKVGRGELMQEGVAGLLTAVGRYDPQLGTPFWSYASWWVRQAMQRLVAELTGPVVLSDRAARMLAQIKQARRQHHQEHKREPSITELVEMTGLTSDQIERLLVSERAPRGLDETLFEDDGATTVGDLIADPEAEDAYERVAERTHGMDLDDLVGCLDERERQILRARYGLGCAARTLRDVAGDHGVSAERVRQIEERALGKLRAAAAWPLPRAPDSAYRACRQASSAVGPGPSCVT